MKRIPLLLVFALISSQFFTSCGGTDENADDVSDDSTEVEDTNVTHKIRHTQKIIYSVPSPSEMVTILHHAGATYNYKLLNDIRNVDKYSSTKGRALNLGIYGADLNYANIFDNTQETMFYIQCTQKITEALGIENAISESTVSRAQDNVDNKDSIINIVSEMFWELHDYLEQNDKLDITAYVITGGWVEGLYLATQTVNEANPNKEIVQKVAELKLSLEHLMALLGSYEQNEGITEMIKDMNRFKELYDKLEVTKTKMSTMEKNGQTIISGGQKISITPEQFKEIKKLAAEIRTNYVSPN